LRSRREMERLGAFSVVPALVFGFVCDRLSRAATALMAVIGLSSGWATILPTRPVPLAGVLLLVAAVASAQTLPEDRKPNYRKLGSRLSSVVEAVDAGATETAALRSLQGNISGQSVPVTIRASDAGAVVQWLRQRAFQIANTSDDVIEAFITLQGLRELNSLPSVLGVREIEPDQLRLVGEGAAAHNALNWQSFGYTGAGIKVGIIDKFLGFSALMGTELPATVTARCYSSIGVFSSNLGACQTSSNHGTAVAEALLDVAPNVQLYIANPKSTVDFRRTIDWMTSQGVRVINYSAAWPWDGPGDGTSPYSDSPLVSASAAVSNGAVFVTAAGNEGQSTWLGSFIDKNGDSWAEFDETGLDDNHAVLVAGDQVALQLRWQDSWTAAVRDLDLGLYDSSYNLVASSTDSQTGLAGDIPREVLIYNVPVTGVYHIGVRRYAGAVPAWIQLQFFSSQALEISTTTGSIGNPAESANPGVLAVGAADWQTPLAIERFSSRGPTLDGRIKPDIVGVDNANSVSSGFWKGTSQASPYVAGLAALVVQAFPAYTPTQVADYLKFFAAARGAKPNNDWGYGLAFLPSIVQGPTMVLDRTALNFGGVSNGITLVAQTPAQLVRLTQSGTGTVTWVATSNQPWLQVSPSTGTGPATLSLSIVPTGLPAVGVVNGAISFTVTGASNTPGPINVTLKLMLNGTSVNPFGVVDTPPENTTGVTGAVPFTGWALDDVEVANITICRAAVAGEAAGADGRCGGAAQIFVGDGVFIEGARPDVQAAYSTYPRNTAGGWGFMVLTNMLPNQGNGTFVLYVYARDREGHVVLLGTRTMTCTNAQATKPFGTIDTPGQGDTVSGSQYVNFGWALTQNPKFIPFDGSTLQVYVDGVTVGSPSYNHYRSDIATLFPGLANSDGAVGFKIIDTTTLSNGLHTIVWTATDSAGITSGLGSRFFRVSNGVTAAASAAMTSTRSAAMLDSVPVDPSSIVARRSWDPEAPWRPYAVGRSDRIVVRGEEIDRFELELGAHSGERYTGYVRVGEELNPLPIGSRLNADTGAFTWSPGVGFVGTYDLVFVRSSGEKMVARRELRFILQPKGSGHVGTQVVIDTPRSQQDMPQPFLLGGWAADLDAAVGTGIDTLHVWAYPLTGGTPVFLGTVTYGGERPDVAAIHGDQYRGSGYGLIVKGLAPGNYDLAVFAWSNVSGGFVPATGVRVTVR
jgi:subtilisin family serine protease